MYKRCFYILLLLLASISLRAQDFNYVHYDTKDGLAGSTVYDECQDKDGFMWFATENGLSRYDGTRFTNFTVKNGLPDNEVLKLFVDRKNRVWISTFNKELCYYYHGKIYNKQRDPMLAKFTFNSSVADFSESDEGVLAFTDLTTINILWSRDSVSRVESQEIFGYKCRLTLGEYKGKILAISEITHPDSMRTISDGRPYNGVAIVSIQNLQLNDSTVSAVVHHIPNSPAKWVSYPAGIIDANWINYWMLYTNTSNGTWELDTVNVRLGNHYLPGKKTNSTLQDKEKNLWFSTLGDGVYKLPSTEIKTINISSAGSNNREVFSLSAYKSGIIAGLGSSKVLLLDKWQQQSMHDYADKAGRSGNIKISNRLYTSKTLSNGAVVLGFDAFLVKLDNGLESFNYSFPIKSIDLAGEHELLVGTGTCVIRVNLENMQTTDTIWKTRSTAVCYFGNKYYVGTLNGLYEVNPDRSFKYLGDLHTSLTRRIAGMEKAPDGSLWIATSDQGIAVYKAGKVTAVITDSNSLSSNICKSMFLQGNMLWVGTNKGVNKIDISDPTFPIITYSMSDGLPSDVINAVYAEDSIVWVGAPAGLTYFNENKISGQSICELRLLGITVSGKEMFDTAQIRLSYKENNISFDFIAISFKSGGEITYHYRLNGLDDTWVKTGNTSLNYPSLPPGNYELELYAVNKYGKKSETLRIKFNITTPFWKTWAFYILVALLLIAITVLLVNRRNKKIRKNLEEKNMFQKQFAALEQQALQSQMNPHFIFNCLNSIQQYILTDDKEKANQYLTGFASLVRQTLDSSEKSTVTVQEEMQYLKQYLDMERMRFGDNFTYRIYADHGVDEGYMEVPALLLQPYTENSLRHGLRYKKDESGRVDVHFYMEGEVLCCAIKDNGVGRKKAEEYKSQQHIEYQSKGMSLTQKRIDLLNKMQDNKITIEVIDLEDGAGNAAGTAVIVKIPQE